MLVALGNRHFTAGDFQPAANRLFRFGPPTPQPSLQFLQRLGPDEDCQSVRVLFQNGQGSLNVNL